jgi:hypothetical protein
MGALISLSWWELSDGFLDGSSQIVVLIWTLRLLSWWELSDCSLDVSSEIVVFMGASQTSHQDNNLRAPFKTTISELPWRQQTQSSHEDNNLGAPSFLHGSSEIFVLMGALRWLSWWEFWDCCLDGSSEIVVLMGALSPSIQQSHSSHEDNNLRPPIKTTIWELPPRQQSHSSHQDKNLRAPMKKTISELQSRQQPEHSSSKIVVLMWPLRWLSWSDCSDCCLDGRSKMVFLMRALRLLPW